MAIFVIRDWNDDLRKSAIGGDSDIASLLPLLRRPQHPGVPHHHHHHHGRHEPVEKSDDFTVNVDVQHFAPEEISVKVVDDHLVVEAEHQDRTDEHGSISRYFKRRCVLPEGYDKESVVSKLSSDGILTVRAAKIRDEVKERVIPIVHTGPHRAVKSDEERVKNKL